MQAAVFKGLEEGLKVEHREKPSPKENEVLIRVHACGICGSDLAILEGRHPSKPPVILGHELGGEVEEVGVAVKSVKIGDHVVVDPNVTCGRCRNCRDGRKNMCENMIELGITKDGAFTRYMVAPENSVYRIPSDLDWKSAALIEPLSCVVHGFKKTRVKPFETAVVYGAGPMGLLWVSMLKHVGTRKVISVDIADKRRKIAEKLGADVSINPLEENPVARVEKETDGIGADVGVEVIGRPETVENTIRSLGPGGRAVIMGVTKKGLTAPIGPFDVMAREIEIYGSNANLDGFIPAIRLVESGVIPVDEIISHEISVTDIQRAISLCRSGEAMKILIIPSD
jgi:2-desacetyl-2-hydroxyethyl bacteriochlorophyllide A dehydrogenase